MVLCGGAMLAGIAAAYERCGIAGPAIRTEVRAAEGKFVGAGEVVAQWSGPAKKVLAGERVALNFLQRLSGVATVTAGYVAAVQGTGAKIYDTRKTTPGWRDLEKYAVRAGGGFNHRRGLYDAVLVKDNHLAVLARTQAGEAMENLGRRLERLRREGKHPKFVEVEVDSLRQLASALKLEGVDIVLLDNMSADELGEAVRMRDAAGLKGRLEWEASGGITLATVRAAAAAGVDRISVGARRTRRRRWISDWTSTWNEDGRSRAGAAV